MFLEPHPSFIEAHRIVSALIDATRAEASPEEGIPSRFSEPLQELLQDEEGTCGMGMLALAIQYQSDPLMGIVVAFLAGTLRERDRH
jgi:hypothetical protein